MNFAEKQAAIDAGELTVEQAARLGSTHKAYGWAPAVPVWWAVELQEAYRRGYDSEPRPGGAR